MNVKDVYGRSGFKYTCQVENGVQGSHIPAFNADLELSHAGFRRIVIKKAEKCRVKRCKPARIRIHVREMSAFGMVLSPSSVFSVFTMFILVKLEMGEGQLKVTSRPVQNLEGRWNLG